MAISVCAYEQREEVDPSLDLSQGLKLVMDYYAQRDVKLAWFDGHIYEFIGGGHGNKGRCRRVDPRDVSRDAWKALLAHNPSAQLVRDVVEALPAMLPELPAHEFIDEDDGESLTWGSRIFEACKSPLPQPAV